MPIEPNPDEVGKSLPTTSTLKTTRLATRTLRRNQIKTKEEPVIVDVTQPVITVEPTKKPKKRKAGFYPRFPHALPNQTVTSPTLPHQAHRARPRIHNLIKNTIVRQTDQLQYISHSVNPLSNPALRGHPHPVRLHRPSP